MKPEKLAPGLPLPELDIVTLNLNEYKFQRATKTKPVKAKPLDSILVDPSVLHRFLLNTIEGHQTLIPGSMVCISQEEAAAPFLMLGSKIKRNYLLNIR